MALVLKVLGQILGAGLVVLYMVFLVGEGGGGPGFTRVSLSLYVALAGLLLGLFRPLAGGILAIVGIAGFYALNYHAVGKLPGGPVFPMFWVAGALLILGSIPAWSAARGGNQ